MYSINFYSIRIKLEDSLNKNGYKKNFKHPVSGIYYNIFVESGWVHIVPKAKSKGQEQAMSRDALLYLWLENDNYIGFTIEEYNKLKEDFTMPKNFESLREEARSHILEVLENYEGYTCDFHNEAFNTDYYECYTDKAIKKLEQLGVFDAIQTVKEYEHDNFGTVDTDFSNPCEVLNMLWYIVGEEELYSMFEDCKEWDEFWNEEIGETETKVLIAWLKDNEKV